MIKELFLDKRNSNVIKTGIVGISAKFINLVLQIISIPLLTNYLGEDKFGVLLVFLSITIFLSIGDLGLGINLQNKLPFYEALNDSDGADNLFISSFLALLIISTLVVILFFIFSFYIDISAFFGAGSNSLNNSIRIIVICFCYALPFGLINKYYSAKLKSYIGETFLVFSPLIVIGLLYLAIYYNWRIEYIAFIFQGIPMIFNILGFVYFFVYFKSSKLLHIKFDKGLILLTLKESFKYLTIPISIILINGPDSIIIAKLLGNEQVIAYNVLLRLVFVFTFPVTLFITPLIYSFNDAISKGDIKWIKKVTQNVLLIMLTVSVLLMVIIFLFISDILNLWMNGFFEIGFSTKLTLYIFVLFTLFHSYLSVVANTITFLSYFIKLFPLAAIISVLIKFTLVFRYRSLEAVFISTVLSITLFFTIPMIYKIYKSRVIA